VSFYFVGIISPCCAAFYSDVIDWYISMPQLSKYIHFRHTFQVVHLSKVSPAVSQYLANFIVVWYILLPFGIFYCHLVYFTAIWYILLPFGTFYCHSVYFTAIWHILWTFGIFHCHLEYFIVIWYILSLGTFCHWIHFVIGYISSFGTFCHLVHFVIWYILSFGTFCHLVHFVIWYISSFGIFSFRCVLQSGKPLVTCQTPLNLFEARFICQHSN
jgi:hypothetical protein